MRTSHFLHWHLPHVHVPHREVSEEDDVVPTLMIGMILAILSVATIYVYSASL